METVKKMLDIGVDGFFSKLHGGVNTVPEAIRTIMQGFDYFGNDIAEIICRIYVAKKKTTQVTSEFTEQEKRVIELSCEGLQGKEVATRLGVNFRTVDSHKRNIFKKLGINNTIEMVQYALKNGIYQMN
jgi:DNA-binding NarL/FixJ family response regulator